MSISVTFSNGGPGALLRSVTRYVTRVKASEPKIAQEAGELGAEVMRGVITSEDRILSGDMLGDVGVKLNGSFSRFGWVDNVQPYYGYQDKGTKYVEAMNAVRTAREVVRGAIPDITRRNMPDGLS